MCEKQIRKVQHHIPSTTLITMNLIYGHLSKFNIQFKLKLLVVFCSWHAAPLKAYKMKDLKKMKLNVCCERVRICWILVVKRSYHCEAWCWRCCNILYLFSLSFECRKNSIITLSLFYHGFNSSKNRFPTDNYWFLFVTFSTAKIEILKLPF